ncbi:MAG: magnesium/cobalt transporter CorA [Bacteroidota bacterium]
MVKLLIRKSDNPLQAGNAPGTLEYIGISREEAPKVEWIVFSPEFIEEETAIRFERNSIREGILWLNLQGVHQVDVVQDISRQFGLHVLTQEEIVNTEQRPKLEFFEPYIFMPLKMIYPSVKSDSFIVEHLSLVLGENFVLTFQEQSRDVFHPIRERLKDVKSRIRNRGTDYLFYALVDAVISNYFAYADRVEEQVAALEVEIYAKTNSLQLKQIQQLQSDVNQILRYLLSLREFSTFFLRSDSTLIQEETHIFVRDLADDIATLKEQMETNREQLRNLRDLYLALVNHRMNEVVKTLTIISTIFIPLTFLSGIYGMNFSYIPELQFRYGYFYLLGIMIVMVLGMMVYFRYRKWI